MGKKKSYAPLTTLGLCVLLGVASATTAKSVSSNRRQTFSHKSCILCKTAGRTSNIHNPIECRYLPDNDKKALGLLRPVTNDACDESEVDLCDDDELENVISNHSACLVDCGLSSRLVECGLSSRLVECGLSSRLVECGLSLRRVNVVQSPVLYTFYQHHPMALTLDTTNMIRAPTARL